MLKIIDKYILKRYLVTFSVMLLMFIPIGIVIDVFVVGIPTVFHVLFPFFFSPKMSQT